ncbi:DoxX family protein [Allobranchiibius sp. GilTou73]|uniref:DoxX family protein n=1 Tax=Allobranchiibius sp. GilTou73 TaxID=2904523 RepID=UPI001F41C70E|nr:DoxX family protein [Allobranchiibius sp. GilTou73]UIJ34435.1 DoxX family protein [Allobranchiibius sp. GilTou73]
MPPLTNGTKVVAALFAGSSVIHTFRPQVFEDTVPHFLPYHRELVYLSGAAEILCAAGLMVPRTRHYAAIASAALLVAVFPANVQMVVDAGEDLVRNGATTARGVTLGVLLVRLPLQWPLVRWAWKARRTR